MSLTIKNHWVQEAKELSTKKKGPGKLDGPHGIVMHYTAGWTTDGDITTLTTSDRQASVQFILGRKGREELYQCMPANWRAWHAGPSKYKGYNGINNYFIGIEICNAGWIKKQSNGNYVDEYGQRIDPEGRFLDYKSRYTASMPKDWHHEYHPRLAKGDYAWEPFTVQQLDALDELTLALIAYYPTIKHIVSHEEIDTRGWKTDPGPVFPMRRYLKLLENRGRDYDPDLLYRITADRGTVVVVYDRPSVAAIGIYTALVGQVFWVDKKENDFYHIYGDGLPEGGWVSAQFLVPTGESK